MKKAILSIIMLSFVIALVACGENDDTSKEKTEDSQVANAQDEGETSSAIEVTDATGQELSFDEVPASFATLDSGVLGILHELDANIVGRPTSSQAVDSALEVITEIGNPHEPNFEMIAQENPDVLIASPSFQQYEDNLKEQGTQLIYTESNSIEDIQDTIHTLGSLLDKETEANDITTAIDQQIEQVEKSDEAVKALLVYGAPGTYLAALPNSLSGDLLEKAGGENIAASFPETDNYPQYANISSEKIIEKNPELIMLITHGDPEGVKQAFAEEMNENPTWNNLDAVKNDRVVILPADLFGSNPGLRVFEALEIMQENLVEAK